MVEAQAAEAFDVFSTDKNELIFYHYRLFEETNNYNFASLYCFVFSHTSYIQLGIYLDEETSFTEAQKICDNIYFTRIQYLH